jgi:uncharacterized protein
MATVSQRPSTRRTPRRTSPSGTLSGVEATPVLDDAEVFDVESDAVGDTFRIFVGRCHKPGATEVPVVYLTDANGAFGLTVDTIRYLQLGRQLPELLVVGIGYPVRGFRGAQVLRGRDLTPTVRDEMHDSAGEPYPSGGADRLLSFVADELQPMVAARHDVADGATYVGHSFGGLFGAHVLLTRPATFRRYVLASPSIWWDDRVLLGRARQPGAGDAVGHADVAILVGAEETPEGRRRAAPDPAPPPSAHDLVADARDFADALVAWGRPDLTVRHRTLPGEHHVTVPSVAVSHGLRALFGAPGADELVPVLTTAS